MERPPAARFEGGSFLKVKTSPALRLGTGDFSIALWVHTSEKLDDDLGDIVTLYDAKNRPPPSRKRRHRIGSSNTRSRGTCGSREVLKEIRAFLEEVSTAKP